MEPLTLARSFFPYRPCPEGSQEGRIVLVQQGTDGASEYGGRFPVKKYDSWKTVTADGCDLPHGWNQDLSPGERCRGSGVARQ